MNQSFMSDLNQSSSPFVWHLQAREAVTLPANATRRALWVQEGRVWMTRQCKAAVPDDVWLDAGQSHTLPAGSEWVIEASPLARVTLVQAAPLRVKPGLKASWARAWRAAAQVARWGHLARLGHVRRVWA